MPATVTTANQRALVVARRRHPDRILHRLPGRLRVGLPRLGQRGYAAESIETWLYALPGVMSSRANVRRGCVVIEFIPQQVSTHQVLDHLAEYVPDPSIPHRDHQDDGLLALVSSGLTLALLPWVSPTWKWVLAALNVSPTLAQGADTLLRRGIKVEVLDAVAVGLSMARGELYPALVTHGLLTLGGYLEQRTARRSDQLLQRLLHPPPTWAWVERDGALVQVADTELRVGDLIEVGCGERVPVDGRVVGGVALVDQAAVTGEHVAVRKEPYRRVISGSVVCEGRLRIEATAVGAETSVARVAHFIRTALTRRSTTWREAERLANQRVYFTLVSGALVYALTRNIQRLQAVFLVDYACALKLGVPIGIKVGMACAARHGVLMRGGEAIERLAAVDTVVFDKTGTLTHSELTVTEVEVLQPQPDVDPATLLALVASVEEHAVHPIAEAVVSAAKAQGLQHVAHGEVDYLVAHGLSAQMPSGRIIIGSRHYLEAHEGIDFAPYAERIATLYAAGRIVLFVGNAQGPLGLIALRDTLRAETPATLARLRQLGIRHLVMISGDRQQRALALGEELGFDAIHAEVSAEDKAQLIRQLQATGAQVAFVGDGINDGPALSIADVGIAMPRGAEIARATADLVLLDDRLAAIIEARQIATATLQRIQFNVRAAIGINTALLLGALSGRISPLASAILHNGTTIGVLLNALRGVRSQHPTD